jgi:amino acid transporter
LPNWLGVVNERTKAPLRAALITTAVTLIMALSLPIERLAELTSLALLAVFACIHAALLKLTQVRQQAGVSPVWPWSGLICCVGVILFQLIRYAV